MAAPDSPLAAFADALACLEREGLPYAVLGGMALAAWGAGRATADADVLIFAKAMELERIAERLRHAGFLRATVKKTEQSDAPGAGLRAERAGFAVDLLAVENEVAREVLSRRRLRPLGPLNVYCVAVEDLIVLKLQAGRARDREDAAALMSVHRATLDHALLQTQASLFGVDEELGKL